MTVVQRVGDFTLSLGQSLRWDDRRQRLYSFDPVEQALVDSSAPPCAPHPRAGEATALPYAEARHSRRDVLTIVFGR